MSVHARSDLQLHIILSRGLLLQMLLVLLSGQITISSGESKWGNKLSCQCSSFWLHRQSWEQQRQWCERADLVPMERWRADEGLYALKFW